MAPLPVMFRKDHGEITAVFPTQPHDQEGSLMVCYSHIGQHGAASPGWVRSTKPATPDEYADLLTELRGIYESDLGGEGEIPLVVVQRRSAAMREAFRAEVIKGAA